jgi:hypothetical protein
MNKIKQFRRLLSLIGVLSLIQLGAAQDTVHVWYGNPDNTPIWGVPDIPTRVDIWIDGTSSTPIANMHLCLGIQDAIIDSIYGCQLLRPGFADIQTTAPEHSPPNPAGWSSRSALLNTAAKSFITTYPIRIFSFFVKTASDPSIVGDTINALGIGVNSIYGHSAIGDTFGGPGYVVIEHYSPIVIAEMPQIITEYLPGDMNSDMQVSGSDISFGVSYNHGQGIHPADSLYHSALPDSHYLYMAADANGDCRNSGADITYLVGYIKGEALALRFCPLLPPSLYNWPR